MKKIVCIGLLIFLTACDSNNPDYVLNETAFCTRSGLNIVNTEPCICTDKYNNLLSGRIIGYFGNGKIKSKFVVKNGKINGKYRRYYEDGSIDGKFFFVDGRVNGSYKVYYQNGNLKSKGNTKNGNFDGNTKIFFENGNLELLVSYKDGKINGQSRQFYVNGILMAEDNYKDGKRDGLSKRYYDNGTLESEVFYKQNKLDGIAKFFYKNGRLKIELSYKNGNKDGLARGYTNFGTLLIEEIYKDDQKQNQKFVPISEMKIKCKKILNVCDSKNPVVGCKKKLIGRVCAVYPDGFLLDSNVFIYTEKNYSSGDSINSDFYYTYVDMHDYTMSDGSVQRVRAYKETDIEALCDDLYKPFL